jgi:hypothetical protein
MISPLSELTRPDDYTGTSTTETCKIVGWWKGTLQYAEPHTPPLLWRPYEPVVSFDNTLAQLKSHLLLHGPIWISGLFSSVFYINCIKWKSKEIFLTHYNLKRKISKWILSHAGFLDRGFFFLESRPPKPPPNPNGEGPDGEGPTTAAVPSTDPITACATGVGRTTELEFVEIPPFFPLLSGLGCGIVFPAPLAVLDAEELLATGAFPATPPLMRDSKSPRGGMLWPGTPAWGRTFKPLAAAFFRTSLAALAARSSVPLDLGRISAAL